MASLEGSAAGHFNSECQVSGDEIKVRLSKQANIRQSTVMARRCWCKGFRVMCPVHVTLRLAKGLRKGAG